MKPVALVTGGAKGNGRYLPKMAVLCGGSKAVLNAWTKGTAKELGLRGIRVNAVSPGRIGTPSDIVNVAWVLVNDAAGYITGEVITVSGGYRL